MRRIIVAILLVAAMVSLPVFAGGKSETPAPGGGAAMSAQYDASKVQWAPNQPRVIASDYKLPAGAKEAIEAEGTKKIIVYNWGDLSWDPATLLNGAAFTRLTGIPVEFVGTPDEQMMPKLQPLFMAKSDAVDIVPLDETNYAAFVSRNWLQQVDFLWDDATMGEYMSGLKSTVLNGHYYSVPQVGRIIDILYYRPSMLRAAGYSGPPTTWAELLDIARKTTIDKTGDGKIDQWGFAFKGGGILDGAQLIKAQSLLLGVNPDNVNGKVVFNRPETVQVVDNMVKMRNEYKVVPPGSTAYQHGDVADFFLSGNVAMVVEPTYLYARAKDSSISSDFGVALQPAATPGGPMTHIQHWNGWGLSVYSKNKTASLIFMDMYRSLQGQTNEFAVENNEVFLKKAYDQPMSKLVGYNDVLAKIDDTVVDLYHGQGEVYKAVISEFQKALIGSKSAQKAMDDAQTEINKIMKY
jgi:multiple sugar transport system substrate-binding protein